MKTIRVVALCVLAVCLLGAGLGERPDRGADVHIVFSGLICHVFDDGHAPRAVAMRGSEGMEHHATLHLTRDAIASSEVLLACDGGECTLDLTNTALRFAAGSGRAHFDRGGSFDMLVPHLRAVTNGEMAALRSEVFDDVPSPASPISAVIELPAGTLSATECPTRAHYEPDLERRGMRPFPREVVLDGHVSRAELLVRRFGELTWQRIRFNADVEMQIVNEPTAEMASIDSPHALLYYDLSATPLVTRPLIISDPSRHSSDIVGQTQCSNTNWP
jgi:hypothetical protein